jgi:hypothetical protein
MKSLLFRKGEGAGGLVMIWHATMEYDKYPSDAILAPYNLWGPLTNIASAK